MIDLKPLKFIVVIVIMVIFALIMVYRIADVNNTYKTKQKQQMTDIFKQTNFIYNSKLDIINQSLKSRLKTLISNPQIINAIKSKNQEKLNQISQEKFNSIKETFPFLSIMHYHLSDFTSFLRVHSPTHYGDNLKDKRPMIRYTIENKSTQIGFETGLHGKSIMYRIAVPIVENDKLLGVLEVGVDVVGIFNKIDNFFKSSYSKDVYLGFILYKNKATHSLDSHKIISNNKIITLMTDTVNTTNNNKIFHHKDKSYFVFWDKENLKSFDNTKVGTIFYAFDITNSEKEYENNIFLSIIQPLMGMGVISLILILLFNYIQKQNIYHKKKIMNIVNNQNTIIVITDSINILNVNNSFLKFFKLKSLDNFLENYSCICDLFENKKGYLIKDNNDVNWIDFIFLNPNQQHKVIINDYMNKPHIFQVNVNKSDDTNIVEYIVTFENITKIENVNKNLEQLVYNKTEELQLANNTLEQRVKEEVAINRKKDKQIIEQSRLAQMGEMISMIAHQWRQPLAAISSTAIALNIKAQFNKLDNDLAIEQSDKISQYSQHLSSTIDDFREFFKSNKELKETSLTSVIESVLNIVEISLVNQNIQIIKVLDCEDIFKTYPNEIKQVVLNLLKNAEDILLEKKTEQPHIKITTYKEKDNIILEISDNAGGIPMDIIDKVFDPYFSTKTKKDGTGLGLYMSKVIIEEHCNGILSVSNSNVGAVFRINLKKVTNG